MVDLVQWWYAKGWGVFSGDLKRKIKDTADTFSIGELLRTLFKPYRQIDASSNTNTSEPFLSVIFGKLVSRLVGFATRTVLIISGIVVILGESLIGGFVMIIWPLIPLLPIAGIVMAIIGVKF